ncbi:MAG TPA: T9SS type A sorting domain-containing protein [Bacteroidia bacterium]|jgi:hypothetical protein|nr:T9SS type A sorting domain-containing protein [Bacteroidia bacterium]
MFKRILLLFFPLLFALQLNAGAWFLHCYYRTNTTGPWILFSTVIEKHKCENVYIMLTTSGAAPPPMDMVISSVPGDISHQHVADSSSWSGAYFSLTDTAGVFGIYSCGNGSMDEACLKNQFTIITDPCFHAPSYTTVSPDQQSETRQPSSVQDLRNNPFFDLLIYPDPVSSVLSIQANGNLNSEIWIMNAEGEIIYHQLHEFNSDVYEIPVSDWNTGIYFIRITSDKSSMLQKIIKT